MQDSGSTSQFVKGRAMVLILFILALAGTSLGEPVSTNVTATVTLKDNTAVTGQILQPSLTFHTKEGRLEIKLEGIKSFGDGRLLLRDGTILSGKLKEDLSIVKEDGTPSILKGRKIVSIVIKDIPAETVTKELVETPKSGKREDKELKSLTREGGYVETGKVPPPPPPPNYIRIFKDASSDTTSYWGSPYYPVPPYIPGPYGGYGTPSGGYPSSDMYGIPSRLTPPQGRAGSAVIGEEIKNKSVEELEGLRWEDVLKE